MYDGVFSGNSKQSKDKQSNNKYLSVLLKDKACMQSTFM